MTVTKKPPAPSVLTLDVQLCLAHYCDLHGPTPLMVTEGLPVPCSRCYGDNVATTELDRPQTSATSAPPPSVTDALRKMTFSASRSSSVPASEQEAQTQRAALLRNSQLSTTNSVTAASPTTASAIETPPQSPRKAATEPYAGGALRRDPSFRRTYDDSVTRRANPCQNCALTLPKRQDSRNKKDKQANMTTEDAKATQNGPTLRTRAPFARVFDSNRDTASHSPPPSTPHSSYPSDDEDVSPKQNTSRPLSHRRPTTSTSRSSAASSTRSSGMASHTHYLDYTSTHEPLVPNTYSIVRASCLRTLSFETLPRRPEHSSHSHSSAPPSGLSSPVTSTAHMLHQPSPASSSLPIMIPQSASAGGGPIFFGDPLAGYTTAYIFRIPDVHARGRKRVYAFLALSTHRERLAMKTFSFLAAAFRDLAEWIQDLAEAEADRERERDDELENPMARYGAAAAAAAYGNGEGPRDSGVGLGGGVGPSERKDDRPVESSFLTGGGRGGFVHRMGGSMGPGGFAPKARGLAELVGLPDFFIELHTRFVRLLLELGVVLGS